jgi:hypothetical protein
VLVRAGVGTAIALTPISALTYGARLARAGELVIGRPYRPPEVQPRGTLLTTWRNFPDGSYVEFSDTTCHGSDRVFTEIHQQNGAPVQRT